MKTRIEMLAGLATLGLLAAPAQPLAEVKRAQPNDIRAVEVTDAGGALELAILGTRAPSFTVFKLQEPTRLVVDLAGADVSAVASPIAVNRGGVAQVTTAQYKDEKSSVGRVIIALEPWARYEVAPRGDAVVVRVTGATPTATSTSTPTARAAVKPLEKPVRVVEAGETVLAPRAEVSADANVRSRRLDESKVRHTARGLTAVRVRNGKVQLQLDGQIARFEVIELESPPRLALDLFGVTRAPRSAVTLEAPFTQARFGRDAGKVRVVLDAAEALPAVQVKRVPGGLEVSASAPGKAPAAAAEAPAPRDPAAARLAVAAPAPVPAAAPPAEVPAVVLQSEPAAAGFAAEAPAYALSGAPQARGYQGRRITLEFHDIEIRNLLRLIADVSKRNIVVADDVSGRVTVQLRNVPWDQALELVLKTKGLDKEEAGNIIRVAKIEQIAKEQEARAKAAAARAPMVPLKVRLIPVNYANAKDMEKKIKDVLTDRGSVATDERTNVLIVKDVQEALARAEGLVRNLDTEIPQVRIESRIVEASSNFTKQLGVQWGGNAGFSQAQGNPTGLAFPANATLAGGAGPGPTFGTAGSPGYAVNLPAAVGQGAGGALGFVFGSAGGAFNLNLRISALENQGVVKTISAPSVSTVDNKEATIGQGISIPFSQVSASGVNTTFIEAKLELKVTPHVSADGSILLRIKVTNNQPNPQLTGANGQPSISKREAETEALVKDGETTVIGGIYTRVTSNRVDSVPVLGKIPILGYFFRAKTDSDDHTELLIFITPRILNRSATAVAADQ